jgi:hypothetical protein
VSYGVFALEPTPVYQQPAPDPQSYIVDLCADFTRCRGIPPGVTTR